MALIALVSTITATAIETTTAEIVARIPITMDPVAGATIKTTAPVMAVVLLSLTEIIIRGIEAMIRVVFFGGLVLGSLFNFSRRSSGYAQTVVYRNAPTISTREIVYVDQAQARSTATAVASGRRLLRDLQGNCFERIVDKQGDEIRVQLEAQECNF